MRALALDTTTAAGSVAVVEDDRIVAERRGDRSHTHAERLPAEIVLLLDALTLCLNDVDLYAVAAGPGSFTGLRIGIATIQGLAFVTKRQVVGVSALEGLAHCGSIDAAPGTLVAAWMDAHRREVFSGLYRVTTRTPFDLQRLDEVEAAAVGSPAATLERWRRIVARVPEVFIGDGAVLYSEAIRAAAGHATIVEAPLLAGAIGRLAIVRARNGDAVGPGGVRPLYVRRPDAEIARERTLKFEV